MKTKNSITSLLIEFKRPFKYIGFWFLSNSDKVPEEPVPLTILAELQ